MRMFTGPPGQTSTGDTINRFVHEAWRALLGGDCDRICAPRQVDPERAPAAFDA
jgi:hypothetical protein